MLQHVVLVILCCVSWVLLLELCEFLSVALILWSDPGWLLWQCGLKIRTLMRWDWTERLETRNNMIGVMSMVIMISLASVISAWWSTKSAAWYENFGSYCLCLDFLIPFRALRTPFQAMKFTSQFFFFVPRLPGSMHSAGMMTFQTAWTRLPQWNHTFLRNSPTLFSSWAEELFTFLWLLQKSTLFCCSRLVGKKASSWGGEVNLPDQTCLLVNKRLISC